MVYSSCSVFIYRYRLRYRFCFRAGGWLDDACIYAAFVLCSTVPGGSEFCFAVWIVYELQKRIPVSYKRFRMVWSAIYVAENKIIIADILCILFILHCLLNTCIMRNPLHTLAKLVATVLLLLLLLSACGGCKDKTDVQPPKQEIVEVQSTNVDSTVFEIIDSLAKNDVKDSVIVIEQNIEEIPVVKEPEPTVIMVTPPPLDSLLEKIFMGEVGVREATGKNDGKDVLKYQKNAGLGTGYSWCACFVKWCFDQAAIKTTITAWSPTCHNKKNIVMMNSTYKQSLRRGDVFTLYYPKLGRIGHTGFVRKKFGTNSVETVEGNTNSAGSREGDGVYVKVRPKSSIYSITRWF